MYCIARTHIYRSIPPDIKEVLSLRNGTHFDESALGLDKGDTDFAAHIRGLQVLLWPGSHLGNVRTFWIYFEIAFCLHSSGQVLVRRHEANILTRICEDLSIEISTSTFSITLPEGQQLKFCVVTADRPHVSSRAMVFSFLSALWLLYAGLVSPIGHWAILRFKRRHFDALERASDDFRRSWHPTFAPVSGVYRHFIEAAYSPACTDDNWDTQLWRHASLYNPWISRGRFDFREAARVIDTVSPSGKKIVVRLFKTTFSRHGGPYTGTLGKAFVDSVQNMTLPADSSSSIDFDDLSAGLAMLGLGDNDVGSSPPWIVDSISVVEHSSEDEVIKVNLGWARHKGPVRNGEVPAFTAAHVLDYSREREFSFELRGEDFSLRRRVAISRNQNLFDWLSTTTMMLVNTKRMMQELESLLDDEVRDEIPGLEDLRYWAVSADEEDLEPKLVLACTGVCATSVPQVSYDWQNLSVHGLETRDRWRWAVLDCFMVVIHGEDPLVQGDMIKGIFPTFTVLFFVGVMVLGLSYVVTAMKIRDVEFEDAAQACIAVVAFLLTPYLTVVHPRVYGGWSVIGALSGVMSMSDCIDRDMFKCFAGRRAELKEMRLLQRRNGLEGYYDVEEGTFIGSRGGVAELQYTYSIDDVQSLVDLGYNLRGKLCVRTRGLHEVWKTATFDADAGFVVIVAGDSAGLVRGCRVGGNAGRHRLR